MVLGRFLITFMTDRSVHDVYSFVVGVYVVGISWYIQEWLLAGYRALSAEGAPKVDVRAHLKTLFETGTIIFKSVYFGLVFGVVMPIVLGFAVDLFVIFPLRTALGDDVKMIFAMVKSILLLPSLQ